MEVQQLKKQYDLKMEQNHRGTPGVSVSNTNYRHAILNEITGPGLTKYLDSSGNIFVLIDEFDGDHKLGMFNKETKSNNLNSSAASVLKSFHTGIPYYQKGKASDTGHLENPQVSFLAASNGEPVMDILRAKIKTAVMPDALVMRTIFDVIDSPPKFNANYKDKLLPQGAIGLELLLLASSLLCNQTYEFDTDSDGKQSADDLLQAWQDNCMAASARWKNTDKWISSRFSKTCELTARLAAQITHIDVAYRVLQEFIIEQNLQSRNGPVTFNTYSQMVDFFYRKYPPNSTNPIIISTGQVEAAMYATKIILLKFFNLFDISVNRSSPILEIPWVPPSTNSHSNPALVRLPATQTSVDGTVDDQFALDKYQLILLYPSICFTFSQIVNAYPKLKYRYDSVEPMLGKLIQLNLLSKYENGIRSGRNVSNLYIKALPESITMHTVNSFVVDTLDRVKMPWTLYKVNCEKVLLPSASALLSEEVRQLFEQDNYRRIIQKYETMEKKMRKKQSESAKQTKQCALKLIDNNIASTRSGLNTSSPNENPFEDDSLEEEQEAQAEPLDRTKHLSPTYASTEPNNSSSSITTNSILSQVPSSTNNLINYLLPRPPLPILHNFELENDIDPSVIETISNNGINDDQSVETNNENEISNDSTQHTNKTSPVNIRRGARVRTKNKRFFSPEPSERTSTATNKKSNTQMTN
ncbi:unnamed protein product [Adineta ricciae]|uniref:Uncharacterized protein n=2 Tax=Adineta ricciae TaxID=249248 RepID=A0A816E7T4_ADIRI|nr:unnamed protein product [Adineta ricciae]